MNDFPLDERLLALNRSRDNLVTMEELYSQAEYAVGEIDSALAKVDITISKIEEI